MAGMVPNYGFPGTAPMLDIKSGVLQPAWFQFFLNLSQATAGGTITIASVAAAAAAASASAALKLPLAGGTLTGTLHGLAIDGDVSASTAEPTGATVARSIAAHFADIANVLDFGADPTGVVDSGPAFNAALATARAVYAPTGTYKISTTILCNRARLFLFGDGGGKTTLMNSTANLPTIVLSSTVICATARISGLVLDRSVTATAGGDGFRTDVSNSFTSGEINLFDIISQHNWQGFALGNSTFSFGEHLTAQNNQSNGFFISNGTYSPANQWVLQNCLSQFNGGDGYAIVGITPTQNLPTPTWSPTNPCYPTMGTYTYCTTFSNLGNGVSLRGSSSARVSDFSLVDSFVGSDGADGIYSDAWGVNNSLVNTTCELSSIYGTTTYPLGIGPNQNVAAPYAGNGINLTANNQDWRILNCSCNQGAYNGIATAAASTLIVGTKVFNYGLHATNTYYGIAGAVGHGTILVEGCVSGGPLFGGGFQRAGVLVQDATQVICTGSDLRGNILAGYVAIANASISNVANCLGYISRNAGVVSVAAGTASYTVPHGLSGTPIVLTGAPNSSFPGWWMDTATATTFVLHFAAAPASAGYFGWQAALFPY